VEGSRGRYGERSDSDADLTPGTGEMTGSIGQEESQTSEQFRVLARLAGSPQERVMASGLMSGSPGPAAVPTLCSIIG
jgi:hypothetical protein